MCVQNSSNTNRPRFAAANQDVTWPMNAPCNWVGLLQVSSIHIHGRPHRGANGVSWPPWKNGWKIKKRKHAKKSSFLCLCYILIAIRAVRCRERRYADNIFYSDILQNAPFRSQIFIIFFASGSKGALTPLTKILRTFLFIYAVNKSGVGCEPIANVFWSPTTLNFQHSRS